MTSTPVPSSDSGAILRDVFITPPFGALSLDLLNRRSLIALQSAQRTIKMDVSAMKKPHDPRRHSTSALNTASAESL